jgi:hypothetical protein
MICYSLRERRASPVVFAVPARFGEHIWLTGKIKSILEWSGGTRVVASPLSLSSIVETQGRIELPHPTTG